MDVLDYAYRIETFVIRTEPILTYEGAPGPPPFPPEEESRRQSAEVGALGSEAMQSLLYEFKEAADAFQAAVMTLGTMRHAHGPHADETREPLLEVQRTREVVRAKVQDVIKLANAELAR